MPEQVRKLGEFVESVYLPWAKVQLKPSTLKGYRSLWYRDLKPRVSDVWMRDGSGDASLLAAILWSQQKISSAVALTRFAQPTARRDCCGNLLSKSQLLSPYKLAPFLRP